MYLPLAVACQQLGFGASRSWLRQTSGRCQRWHGQKRGLQRAGISVLIWPCPCPKLKPKPRQETTYPHFPFRPACWSHLPSSTAVCSMTLGTWVSRRPWELEKGRWPPKCGTLMVSGSPSCMPPPCPIPTSPQPGTGCADDGTGGHSRITYPGPVFLKGNLAECSKSHPDPLTP